MFSSRSNPTGWTLREVPRASGLPADFGPRSFNKGPVSRFRKFSVPGPKGVCLEKKKRWREVEELSAGALPEMRFKVFVATNRDLSRENSADYGGLRSE